MVARPTKLNKTVQNKIIKVLRTGVSINDACAYVGIDETTFYGWMRRGEAGEQEFLQFFQSVNRARNAAKVKATNTLHAALSPTVGRSKITDTFTEDRTDSFGHLSQYKTVKEHEVVTSYPADWRAAVEYLKRRYPDDWSEKRILELGISPELLKRLEDVAKQANVPASQLFENMINAIADQLSVSSVESDSAE